MKKTREMYIQRTEDGILKVLETNDNSIGYMDLVSILEDYGIEQDHIDEAVDRLFDKGIVYENPVGVIHRL